MMEQISKEPEGNHESSDQTLPVVNESSSDASSQASEESSDKSNESKSEVRGDASGETSQESNESNEVSDAKTDDGSYIENEDDDDNWSDDYYLAEQDSSPPTHQHRHYPEQYDDEHSFQGIYVCYPLSTVGKLHLENGNQIIMPPSVLKRLLYLEIEFPMLFEIRKNQLDGRLSHCGVSEFTAEEGKVHLPKWMMENLELEPGDFVNIRSVNLENGTYVKIQPHTTDFLSISNPKAALEEGLTNNFFCLTTGDTIMINFGGQSFYVNIVDTKPSSAISIINTDCEVDFDLDYKEPEKPAPPAKEEKAAEVQPKFVPFTGMARRLNEACSIETGLLSSTQKQKPRTDAAGISVDECISKGINDTNCEAYFDPPLDYKQPKRPSQPVKEERAADEVKPKFVFAGVARRLRGTCSIEADLSSTQKEKPRTYAATTSVGNSMSKGIIKEKIETETSKKESFQAFTGMKYSLRG